VGYGARAFGFLATSMGQFAGSLSSAVDGATSIGAYAGNSGPGAYSTSIGAGDPFAAPEARGSLSIAIGGGDANTRKGAQAAGTASIAIGNKSIASGTGYASALGYNARAHAGLGPTAMGTDSHAAGTNASAFGRFAAATNVDASAIGAASLAKG
jgi:hypothetical protein